MVIIDYQPLEISSAYMPVVFSFYKDSLDTVKSFKVEVYNSSLNKIHEVYAKVSNIVANRYFGYIDLQDIVKNYVPPSSEFNNSHGNFSSPYLTGHSSFRFYVQVDSNYINPTTGFLTPHNAPAISSFITIFPFTQNKKQNLQAGYLYSNQYNSSKNCLTLGNTFQVTPNQMYWLSCIEDVGFVINAVRVRVRGRTQDTTGFISVTATVLTTLSVDVGTTSLPTLDHLGFYPAVNMNDISYYEVEFGELTITGGPGGHTFTPRTALYKFIYKSCNPNDRTVISYFNTAGGCNTIVFTEEKKIASIAKSSTASFGNVWDFTVPNSHDYVRKENFKINSNQRDVFQLEHVLETYEAVYLEDLLSSTDVYIIEEDRYVPITILDGEIPKYNNEEIYDRLIIKFEYSQSKVIPTL